jgi:hypothetical protein
VLRSLLLAPLTMALLLPAVGCGKGGGAAPQPKLANPGDPRVRGLEPATGPVGGTVQPEPVK